MNEPLADSTRRDRVLEDGFLLIEGVIEGDEVEGLRRAVEALVVPEGHRGGVRGVLEKSPVLRRFAHHGAPAALAREVLGPTARPIKGTLFDKTPGSNWLVPWHQDLTITVDEQKEVDGFGPWTVKDGVAHVQPPSWVLDGVLAVRVHLDPAAGDSGALRVVPGSHKNGQLSKGAAHQLRATKGEITCAAEAGGVLLMFPLLLHSSSPCRSPSHRRVLHLEYSAVELPGGLHWVQ